MTEIEQINNILQKIVFDGASFNLALRSCLKNEKRSSDKEFVNSLTSVCGGFLRHYYSLERAVKTHFPQLDKKEQQLIAVILSDKLFSRKLNHEELLKLLKKENPDVIDEAISFIDSFNEPFELIDSSVVGGSDEYFHLRYNLPLFVVKMWRRNCKGPLSLKLIKSFKNKRSPLLRIDTNKISCDEFLEKYSEYQLVDNCLAVEKEFNGSKGQLPIVDGNAFKIHGGYTAALQNLDIDLFRGVAVYGACNNDILSELYAEKGNFLKIDYICGNQKHFFEVKSRIKKFSISDISVYECGYDAIRTCISKPVHTFIVSPENTSFQKLAEESDYFLSVNQDKLDDLIIAQKVALKNASELVEDGGQILYVLPTLCRNETYGLIKQFLSENPNITLEKEVQLFPFDKYQSLLYFAILRKGASND